MDELVLPVAAAAGLGWVVGRAWRPLRAVAHLGARVTVGAARQGATVVGHGLDAGSGLAEGAARAAAPPARAGAAAAVGLYEGVRGRFVASPDPEAAAPAPTPTSEAEPRRGAPAPEAPPSQEAPAPSDTGPEPGGDLVAVSGGTKYHEPGCRMLGASSQLVERAVAEEEGRQPCGVCRP